jgi:phosphate:Na+ symporter
MLIGGLGLFLLAITMITDGLKFAAGSSLRTILANSTATRMRGVGSGILVTALVQSSSAVTVATIGFVNAGLLTLGQALGVVYGANIGTTMTGWLVAAIGLEFKIETFALPLIGLGMLLRLLGKATKRAALGEVIAGFGLFFLGVDALREGFTGITTEFDITRLTADSPLGILLYVLFGFITTLLTQSSSAAIAITLTAATGGLLAIDAAAAMVIGANVGTTSTAVLSVIGATSNAKRVATAHVIFNFMTAAVALLLLPIMLALVDWTRETLALSASASVNLALFHTIFNVLGVLLMWPLTTRLADFLQQHFITPAEALSRPMHLDKNVLAAPSLGLDALLLEQKRLATLSRKHTLSILSAPQDPTIKAADYFAAIHALIDSVESFVSSLERERLSEPTSNQLPGALRINTYLEEVANMTQELASNIHDLNRLRGMHTDVSTYLSDVANLVSRCDPDSSEFSLIDLQARYEALHEQWHLLKTTLLESAVRKSIPLANLNPGLERLRMCLRIAEQSIKATRNLKTLEENAHGTGA